MNAQRTSLACIAALALGLTTWTLVGGRAPVDVSSSTPVEPTDVESAALAAPLPAQVDPARRTPQSSGTSNPISMHIAGRVVDASGASVPRASVTTSRGTRTAADENGEFVLDGVEPGAHYLRAAAEGQVARWAPPVRVGMSRSVNGVVLELESAVHLAGVVQLEDGTPIGGARLEARLHQFAARDGVLGAESPWAEPVTAESDLAGRFVLGPLPHGVVDVVVRHAEHWDFGRRFRTPANDALIVLTPATGLRGRVLAADSGRGLAVSQITVFASQRDEDGPWRAIDAAATIDPTIQPAGSYYVPLRTTRWVRVVAEGEEFAAVSSAAHRIDDKLGLELPPLLASRGQVVSCSIRDADEHALAGASVTFVRTGDGLALPRACPPTGADGATASQRLEVGTYRVELSKAGYFAATIDGLEVTADEELPVVTAVLAPASGIRGSLRAGGGGSLPDLVARARRIEGGARTRPATVQVESRTFAFAELASGDYQLDLVDAATRSRIYATQRVTLEAGSVEHIDIDIDGLGVELTGAVTVDGELLTGAEVTLRAASDAADWFCTTDRDGRFLFAGVPAGRWILRARVAPDAETFGVAPIDVAAQPIERDVVVSTRVLRGRLTNPEGDPIRRARVVVEQGFDTGPVIVAELTTDRDGEFYTRALPSAATLLSTDAGHYVNHRRISIAEELVELKLEPAGSLRFHLRKHKSMAREGDIELRVRASGRDLKVHRFGPGQRPLLEELAAGEIEVAVRTSDGHEQVTHPVVVLGETRTVLVSF